MTILNWKKATIIFVGLFFLTKLMAQDIDAVDKIENMVVTARVVFVDDYSNEISMGVRKNTSKNYLVLLDIIDTDNICYEHIVAYYSLILDLKVNEVYNFSISKKETQYHYFEEKRNDTILLTRLEGMSTRLTCKHRVLANPADYKFSFYIESVSEIE